MSQGGEGELGELDIVSKDYYFRFLRIPLSFTNKDLLQRVCSSGGLILFLESQLYSVNSKCPIAAITVEEETSEQTKSYKPLSMSYPPKGEGQMVAMARYTNNN